MHRRVYQQCALGFLFVAIFVAVLGLLVRSYYELSGVLHGDAMIFQTVGRGILNGYLPYRELFETKPPGIFIIHAVSLWMFGNQLLVKLLQVFALLVIPVCVFIPAVHAASHRPIARRQIVTLTSLLFGLVLSLYTADQAGMGLTESYGAAVGIVYLGLVFLRWNPGVWIRRCVLGVLMLVAVGIKEPFVLVLLSGVLFLRKDLKEYFLYPLCGAAALGLLILLLLGWIEPFFTVYLKHMLNFHVHQHDSALPLRALEIWRTFINMGAYSWWMAIAITLVWVTSFRTSQLVRWVVASYLFFLAIAVGGDFYGHHFIFAVPCFAALYWIVLHSKQSHEYILFGVTAFLILACIDTRFSYDIDGWKQKERDYKAVAATIDAVMDRCGYDQYLQMIVRGGGPYAYTTHSPYGPIFVHYSRFLGGSDLYQSEHIRALREAPLVFILDIENSNLTDVAQEYIGVTYAEDPPACAGEQYTSPEPYHLLFRQT